MTSVLFVVALLYIVCTAHVASQAHPNIEVYISNDLVMPGATVAFVCRVKDVGSGSQEPHINLLKGVINPGGIPYSEFISQNTILRKPYNMERFHVGSSREGDDVILTLTIAGVLKEDSGNYGCSTPGLDDLYAVTHLSVYNPPGPVVLSYNGTELTNNSITLMEGDNIPLTCRSSGGIPEPAMNIYVKPHETVNPHHDHPVKHRDINDLFLVSTDKNVHCKENPAGKDCPLNIDYDIIGEARTFKALAMDDGEQVTCAVTMRVFNNDSQSRSVALNILYKPTINCTAPTVLAVVNQTDVKISCTISSNPPTERTDRQWTLGACGRKPEGILGIQSAEYRIQQTNFSPDSKKLTYELTITKVTKDFFGKKYCARASNEIGPSTMEFTLKEAYTGAGIRLSSGSAALQLFSLPLMFSVSRFF